jgi:uncharacterized protein YndB with AHSA1/START domain
MEIERSITVDTPVGRVFAYVTDLSMTPQWDPGTVSAERVAGEGGVGTRYRTTARFLGRKTVLDYLVIESVPEERFVVRGENATVVAHDTMTFVRTGDTGDTRAGEGTTVTYRAELEFKGIVKLVEPLLAPAFRKRGDEAEQGLRAALGRLG